MCGRYSLTKTPNDIAGRLDVRIPDDCPPRYNVAPGQWVPVLRAEAQGRIRWSMLKWGLVPSWAKDAAIGNRLINARSESVDLKPAFKSAWKRRRCLAPADGFYEWKKSAQKKRPHRFVLKDDSAFLFGAIWEGWQAPDGTELESVCILTTEANSLVRDYHDRMPVIIPVPFGPAWLFEDSGIDLKSLCKPIDPQLMRVYEVDPVVNSPTVDMESCISPLKSGLEQGELFD